MNISGKSVSRSQRRRRSPVARRPAAAAVIWLPALLLAPLVVGCLSPERQRPVTDKTILLRAAAAELKGGAPQDVVVQAAQTVADVPLTTRLVRNVAEKTKNAVASIYVQTATPYRVSLLPISIPGTGLPVKLPGAGLGSGFFIHPSGYLLTNNPVVRNATAVKVLLRDGRSFDVTIVSWSLAKMSPT